MKHSILILAALAALLSCSKQEGPVVPQPSELTLTVASTKAFTETVTDTLKSQGFDAGVIFDNGTKTLLTASQHLTWDGTVFKFASPVYSPITDGNMTVCGAHPFSPAVTSSGATLTLSQDDIAFEKDAVVCCNTVSTPISGSVALSFRHILSRVSVEAVAEDDDYDYRVTKCVISSPSSGTYDLVAGTWGGLGTDTAKVTHPMTLDGVGIQHNDGRVYTKEEWQEKGFAASQARGVAVGDGTHELLLSDAQGSKLVWSHNMTTIVPGCTLADIDSTQALADFSGKKNTDALIAAVAAGTIEDAPAAQWCRNLGTDWYLPAAGEAYLIERNHISVDECLALIGGTALSPFIWSSTQGAEDGAWRVRDYVFLRARNKNAGEVLTRAVSALDRGLKVTTTSVTISENLCVIPCDATITLLWECRDKTTGELERTVSGTGTVTAKAGEHAVCRVTVGAE